MTTAPKQEIELKQLFVSDAGTVSALVIGAGGADFTTAPAVTFIGACTRPAQAVAEIAAGAVSALHIIDPGEGYAAAPTVGFTGGGGTGATATATVNAADASGRFKFLCFVTSCEAQEQRSFQERRVRDCDVPSAKPVTQVTSGSYSANYSLTGFASPARLTWKLLRNAIRSGRRLEFQDKDDMLAKAGGGADVFLAYMENLGTSMPDEGTVGFTATLKVDGAKAWAPAA
ncbi:hypothetical protein [Phreatobacter sp.]|uniref:hypothetical protein n=1 Tax=Phreatobacter sp. TaxID=1966341 RepID=UPI003F6EBF17